MESNFFDEESDHQDHPATNTADQEQHQTQQAEDNEFGEVSHPQGEDQQGQQQYQQFQEAAAVETQLKQDYTDINYYPEEMTPQIQEMKKRDEEINDKLQHKAVEERRIKDERKRKAAEDLNKFKSDRTKQIESRKTQNKEQASNATQSKSYSNPWQKVVENIAIKAGENPGQRDISRMREALLRKSKDSA